MNNAVSHEIHLFISRVHVKCVMTGPKIAVCFPGFPCLSVYFYLLVCTSTCEYYYVTYFYQQLLAKLQQASVVLCCLDGEKVAASRDNPVFAFYSR